MESLPVHRTTTSTPGLAALATQISQAMYPEPDNLQEAVVGVKEQALIESSYLAIWKRCPAPS